MAIRIGDLTDSSLVARKLSVTQPIVVASPGYIEEFGAPEAPEDLAAHNCLLYSYLSTANVWRFTAPDGREIPVAVTGNLRVNNGMVNTEAALSGMGILMTPTFYVGDHLRNGKLRRVLEGYTLPELGIH